MNYFNLKDYNKASKNLNLGRRLSTEKKRQVWIEKADKYLSELKKLKT